MCGAKGPIPCLKAAITQEALRMNNEHRYVLLGIERTYSKQASFRSSNGLRIQRASSSMPLKGEAAVWSAIWRDVVITVNWG
jgi:hypothetical protein